MVDGTCTFDEAEVVDLVRNMDDGRLVKVNAEVFTQVMGISVDRNVWISPLRLEAHDPYDTVELYASIDSTGSSRSEP